MARKLELGSRIVVASHNQGKIAEIADLVAPCKLEVLAAADLGLREPEETGLSFAANAELKALAAATSAELPALSDDSGLEIEALDGAPGIYSARWAGPTKDFGAAMVLVEDRLKAVGALERARRRANFTCALCLAWPDGATQVFEGRVFGELVHPPRGTRGFGYDPIFLPDGYDITFGEMDPAQKHAISHRAKAFALFVDASLATGQS